MQIKKFIESICHWVRNANMAINVRTMMFDRRKTKHKANKNSNCAPNQYNVTEPWHALNEYMVTDWYDRLLIVNLCTHQLKRFVCLPPSHTHTLHFTGALWWWCINRKFMTANFNKLIKFIDKSDWMCTLCVLSSRFQECTYLYESCRVYLLCFASITVRSYAHRLQLSIAIWMRYGWVTWIWLLSSM